MLRETYVLSLNLLDGYFNRGGPVAKSELQELGIACMGVASKFGETGGNGIMVDERAFSRERIGGYEIGVLRAMGFLLRPPNYAQISSHLIS